MVVADDDWTWHELEESLPEADSKIEFKFCLDLSRLYNDGGRSERLGETLGVFLDIPEVVPLEDSKGTLGVANSD